MFKRVVATLVAFICAGALAAFAANIPLLTGPVDPGNLRGTLNTLIQSINANVGGLANAQTGATSTAASTSETNLQTYTMPANMLSAAGQSIRITCWGRTAANGNNKTRKLYFGANVITTATEAANNQPWVLSLTVMRTGAATQAVFGTGMAGLGGITMLSYVADGVEALTAGVLIRCTGTNGTANAGDITANGMITELLK